MFDLLGFSSILIVCFFAFIVAVRFPFLSNIIFVALLIRVFFLILGQFYFNLPDSTGDAETYEKLAWKMAQGGFFNLADYYVGPQARFITLVIAIPYSLFGRSILMAKSLSLFFGLASIFVGYFLAKKLWNDHTAKKVGWIMALFPSLVLYSVLIMREMYVCFFLLVALYGVVSWSKKANFKSILIGMAGFTAATFFHGGMIIGAMVFLIFIGFVSTKQILKSLLNLKINIKLIFLVLIFFSSLGYYVSGKVRIPYLGNFETLTKSKVILRKTKFSTAGEASYPKWTIANSTIELFYKVPVRSIYFIFAPFPWDIKKLSHLIGMFDALFYIYFVYLIMKNLKTIWNDPSLRLILIILLAYIIVFSVAVGNFGTSIRHRSKFTSVFLLLAAPFVKSLILSKNKKFKNHKI